MAVVDPVGGVDGLTMREVPRGEHISNACPYFPPHYPHLGTLDCYFASFERYPLRVHWDPRSFDALNKKRSLWVSVQYANCSYSRVCVRMRRDPGYSHTKLRPTNFECTHIQSFATSGSGVPGISCGSTEFPLHDARLTQWNPDIYPYPSSPLQ